MKKKYNKLWENIVKKILMYFTFYSRSVGKQQYAMVIFHTYIHS